MLLFNNDGNITGAVIKRISIHLMLLFNAFIPVMLLVITYFNTSNVTIQLAKINLGNFRSIISIHLMLLFNHIVLIFQHLLLQISIHLMLLFNLLIVAVQHRELYFNTSNVTIQLIDDKYDILCVSYFNTSNVTIQH